MRIDKIENGYLVTHSGLSVYFPDVESLLAYVQEFFAAMEAHRLMHHR